MKINISDVAKLANLPLTKDEEKKLVKQLEETLEYVEKLNGIDTKNTLPTNHVSGLENVTRDDKTSPSLSQEETMKNAKSKYNGFFKVPAILED